MLFSQTLPIVNKREESMDIKSITIIGGIDKNGSGEPVREIRICKGEIYGIVGPTGSGKSQLISDIEQLAQNDTATQRQILVNGIVPEYAFRNDPRRKMVAQLSQNMNFFADMPVADFLKLHAKCRGKNNLDIRLVLERANTLTGEPVKPTDNLTTLSGGQTRALMVADVAVISESPVVLIDEIENAGIKKNEALEMLSGTGKIILVVTHDPVLALSSQKRIIMRNGGMQGIIQGTPREKSVSEQLNEIDKMVLALRDDVRHGRQFDSLGFEVSMLQNNYA